MELIYRSPENPYSYHTAIARSEPSFPVRYLLRNGYITGRVLDFGCGQGADVRFLHQAGIDITGFDPHYAPESPQGRFDTILCTYVLNVLLALEQTHVLMAISELLAPTGHAYFTVRRDIPRSGFRRHAVRKTKVYQCHAQLPYSSLLRTNHCEIYEYLPLGMLSNTNPDCMLCCPRDNLSLITESATVYAVHSGQLPDEYHVLVIPKLHEAEIGMLPERINKALEIVATRVQSILAPHLSTESWTMLRHEGAGEHAHLVLLPRPV
jgi:SAM-dependent methyltransferase